MKKQLVPRTHKIRNVPQYVHEFHRVACSSRPNGCGKSHCRRKPQISYTDIRQEIISTRQSFWWQKAVRFLFSQSDARRRYRRFPDVPRSRLASDACVAEGRARRPRTEAPCPGSYGPGQMPAGEEHAETKTQQQTTQSEQPKGNLAIQIMSIILLWSSSSSCNYSGSNMETYSAITIVPYRQQS